MAKGQASAELMIILAAALVVLIAVYSYSSQSVTGINKQKLIETAKTSVNDLKNAANDVYAQGVGAKKQVYFVVPQGVNQPASGVIGQSIVLNLLGSDIYAKANTQITGQIPTTPGGHWVWVTAFENYVAIGTQNFSADKTSSYVTLPQSSSIQDTINLTNSGTENATVTISNNWANSNVTLAIAPPSPFALNAGTQQAITLTYTSNASAAGNYPGSLEILADFPTAADENISIPANAEVIPSGGGPASSLIILPLTFSTTIAAGNSDSSSFSVCNNSNQTLTSISFSKTGTISGWITPEPIPAIASLGAGQCQQEIFTITVAGSQAAGTYTGNITAASGANSDSIDLTVQVTPQPPKLAAISILKFSDPARTVFASDFNEGATVYYQIKTFDQYAAPLDVTTLDINIIDPSSTAMQNLSGQSTTGGIFNGSYALTLTAATGGWTIGAKATYVDTAAQTSSFTATYYPFLSNVNVLLFSNAAYTAPAVSFVQGSTVYYEIQTFDQFASALNLTDLNVQARNPSGTIMQNLTGLATTAGKYQGNYALLLSAATGTWNMSADANKNNTITDSNNFTVTPAAECATQALCFSQSWSGAAMTCFNGGSNPTRYCTLAATAPFWTIQNTASATTLTITRMRVSWTGDTDGDTTVDDIIINNIARDPGSSGNGAWNNISDITLSPMQLISTNNWLKWLGSIASTRMNNQTETYTVTFEFSDLSTYSTTAYNPP